MDDLDRKILRVVCSHDREGQSFNKLVRETESFVSRSTFASRVNRLERLGYVEKLPDVKERQMKRIRGKPLTLLIVRLSTRIRKQCNSLSESFIQKKSSLESRNDAAFTEQEIAELGRSISLDGERLKGIFSLIGAYAVLFGESVAGDFLVPLVIDDFKRVNSELLSLLTSKRKLASSLAKERLAMIPLDELKDDYEYAFGKPLNVALPNFSKHFLPQS